MNKYSLLSMGIKRKKRFLPDRKGVYQVHYVWIECYVHSLDSLNIPMPYTTPLIHPSISGAGHVLLFYLSQYHEWHSIRVLHGKQPSRYRCYTLGSRYRAQYRSDSNHGSSWDTASQDNIPSCTGCMGRPRICTVIYKYTNNGRLLPWQLI